MTALACLYNVVLLLDGRYLENVTGMFVLILSNEVM